MVLVVEAEATGASGGWKYMHPSCEPHVEEVEGAVVEAAVVRVFSVGVDVACRLHVAGGECQDCKSPQYPNIGYVGSLEY